MTEMREEQRPVVGVIGLGDIGSGVAASVLRHGLPLVVCDVRVEATDPYVDEAAATVATSPADLAAQSDVVVVAVVNDAQVRTVLSGTADGSAGDSTAGVLASARPDATVIIVSTVSAATVQAMGDEARAAGVGLVDCGVSGGPSAAASGELVCMVGGDTETIDGVRPVLDAIGSLVVRMGPLGSGLLAKLARNVVQYGSWLAAYEAQVLAEASGVELAKLAQVIKASDARIGGATTLMFRPTVAPFNQSDDAGLISAMRSAAALAHKDLRAALEAAGTAGVDMPLTALTDEHCDQIFGVGR